MRAFTRRRFWIALRYRLGVLGACFAYLLAALEIPLPLVVHKDSNQPFPCQNHPCGCRTAEQCWSHCCCFTPEERWAWAKAHKVEPPAYAEKPAEKPAALGWNRVKLRDRDGTAKSCCCAKQPDASASAGKSARSVGQGGQVTVISAWRCQGYSTLWVSAGAVLFVPPMDRWSPDWSSPTSVALLSVSADSLPSTPLDPPPRLCLV